MISEKWVCVATAFGADSEESPYFWDIESRLELSQAYCSASEARIGTGGWVGILWKESNAWKYFKDDMNENSIGNIKIIFYIVEILSFGGVQAQKLKNLLWAPSESLSVPFPHGNQTLED